MPLNRSLRPIALRSRKMHIPGRQKRVVVVPPPPPPPPSGNFPPYIGWEFDSNLTDTSGQYTISGGSATFPSGGAIGNYWDFAQFSNTLTPAPDFFRLTWDDPWAISVWWNFSATNHSIVIEFYINSTLATANQSWIWTPNRNSSRLIVYDSSGSGDIGDSLGHTTIPINQWNFSVIRYDPANNVDVSGTLNYQVDTIINGNLVRSQLFDKLFRVDTDYTSSQTFRIRYGFGSEKIDQTAIWKGQVLTDQNIADLYNNGAGMPLP